MRALRTVLKTARWSAIPFCLFALGCDGTDDPSSTETATGANTADADSGTEPTATVTFYDDIAPIVEERCLHCHQDDGIGSFAMDSGETAAQWAPAIKAATGARTMPPWFLTDNGSCGEFVDSQALTDEEIALIAEWADNGAPEGEPRELNVPELPVLEDATSYLTPEFFPERQGGALAQFDEYRCFLVDPELETPKFITGYDVLPGNAELVHHALLFTVTPGEDSEMDGLTNGELMEAMDADSPDRDGWPCFGMAGEGVNVAGVPVSWAPGQGRVEFPQNSGLLVQPGDQFVIQVHYNLSDPDLEGESDETEVQLRLEDEVENVGFFILNDPLLGSLLSGGTPETLPPGEESFEFTWSETVAELGFADVPAISLAGILPHMHERGRKYQMRVGSEDGMQCQADVQNWDFNWQRQYFYQEPITVTPDTDIEVTCDYNTEGVDEAILPGWGTRNEMCLAVLYFILPVSALE